MLLYISPPLVGTYFFFFFLTLRPPPRSTLFPYRRSSDLLEAFRVRLDLLGARFESGHHDVVLGGSDRKSTRLNSSHLVRSYDVFCLKKKNTDLMRVRAVQLNAAAAMLLALAQMG